MFDATLRRFIDPPLARAAGLAVDLGLSANGATVLGFMIGLGAVPLLAVEEYGAALGLILLSRFFDGLDGAIARRTRLSDFGGFLDISLDFIFYAGVVFGFALARPENALPAAFLLFAFMGPAATFLAYAILAAKRGVTTEIRGRKSVYYLGGLSEGFETIMSFVLACLFPDWFAVIAIVYGIMCFVTAGTRIAAAYEAFSGPGPDG